MARSTRRKYWKRRFGTRWAPNIVKISNLNEAAGGEFFNYEDLAENPLQTNTGVSQTFTVKNFEITFTIEPQGTGNSTIESVTAYIMYVPQGMAITSTYYADHPEYIMAYKYLGSPTGIIPVALPSGGASNYETQQFQPIKIRTRLSRKLQTGDKVVLYIQGSNESVGGTTARYTIDGIVRWWSKAN